MPPLMGTRVFVVVLSRRLLYSDREIRDQSPRKTEKDCRDAADSATKGRSGKPARAAALEGAEGSSISIRDYSPRPEASQWNSEAVLSDPTRNDAAGFRDSPQLSTLDPGHVGTAIETLVESENPIDFVASHDCDMQAIPRR